LREANAITLELARGHRDYLPSDHDNYVDGLLRAFDCDCFSRLACAGPSTNRPVFVVGLPRSGTTLIEQILASHSQVHGAGELRLARRSFESIPALLGRFDSSRDCIASLDPSAVVRLAADHLRRLEAIDAGRALRIVDKMPDNCNYERALGELFDALP